MIKWPWQKKRTEPDISILIDYYEEGKALMIHAYPNVITNEEVLRFMDLATELIECEEIVEFNDPDDIEKFIASADYRQAQPENLKNSKGNLRLVKK